MWALSIVAKSARGDYWSEVSAHLLSYRLWTCCLSSICLSTAWHRKAYLFSATLPDLLGTGRCLVSRSGWSLGSCLFFPIFIYPISALHFRPLCAVRRPWCDWLGSSCLCGCRNSCGVFFGFMLSWVAPWIGDLFWHLLLRRGWQRNRPLTFELRLRPGLSLIWKCLANLSSTVALFASHSWNGKNLVLSHCGST